MSIGAVLDLLRPDFPDVTISKIRFLEAEGLVTPQRSPSGYRRFTAYDSARLRFILTAQRDHYLPLKVIKAQLDSQPDGELPRQDAAYPAPRLVPVGDESELVRDSVPAGPAPVRSTSASSACGRNSSPRACSSRAESGRFPCTRGASASSPRWRRRRCTMC